MTAPITCILFYLMRDGGLLRPLVEDEVLFKDEEIDCTTRVVGRQLSVASCLELFLLPSLSLAVMANENTHRF